MTNSVDTVGYFGGVFLILSILFCALVHYCWTFKGVFDKAQKLLKKNDLSLH